MFQESLPNESKCDFSYIIIILLSPRTFQYELPGIVRTSHRVGIVYEDEEHTSYCPNCQTVGVTKRVKKSHSE